MSAIQWTDQTWNPTVGCSRVSSGCDHCYAIKVAQREMQPAHVGLTRDGDWTGEVRLMPDRLDAPLHWRKPRRVFVNSMSDLFHEDIDSAFIASVFDVMAKCPQHTFQVLTKRAKHMAALSKTAVFGEHWPLPNVWLGVSVEDDRYARIRIPPLLRTPAAVRFLSVEPLLGDVDLAPYLDLDGIQWVIVGGESGPGARPMDLAWVERIIANVQHADVPVFVKQLGSVWAKENGATDRKGGDPGEWPEYLRVREWPA